MRIVTYKVLEEKKTHQNATQASIFTVCQERKKVNRKLTASQPFVVPVKVTFAEVDAKRYLLDPTAVLPGVTYLEAVQKLFSPAIQEIVTGKKPNAYNDLLTTLLEEGKKLAEGLVK